MNIRKKEVKVVTIEEQIYKAIEELEVARVNESNADPEFIEIAIQDTNIARMKLNNLIRKAKLLSINPDVAQKEREHLVRA